ncbi:MAG: MerR family transcriptional regulator [Chloroflexota bacterium]
MSDRHNENRAGYLSVGRFSQATQLSRKALRLYDQLGILVPASVDPESGYRYYSVAQIEKARFVRLLRAMEMPLADIRRVLTAKTSEEATQLVIDSRHAFEIKAERVRQASHKALAYLRREEMLPCIDILVKQFPTRQAVAIQKSVTIPAFNDFIPQTLAQLRAYASKAGAIITGDPICFYHGPVNENDDGPVEVCLPVQGPISPSRKIVLREIPAHQAAIGVAAAKYRQFPAILEVWDAVVSWVHQNKFDVNDNTVVCYEIWHPDNQISVVHPFETGE